MRVLRHGLGALALLFPLLLGFSRSGPLRIDPGPADPAYSVDLPARYRVGEPSFFRWLGRGGLDLPFALAAPGELLLDYQTARPAVLDVHVDDRAVGELQLLSGRGRAKLVLPEGSPLRIRFLEREPDAEDRRRASFFRIQIESPRILPVVRAIAAAVSLPILVYLLLLLARLEGRYAFVLALVTSSVLAYFLGTDPYAAVRLVERLLLPVGLWGGLFALGFRFRQASSWIYAAFLLGTILRLAIVLHPSAYHYDHAAHAGMVQALLDRGLVEFWNVREDLQLELNVGEIHIGGVKRAFPYPTFFFLATAATSRIVGSVDYGMMIFSSLFASLEVLFVVLLSGVFLDQKGRIYAAWASALYPAGYGVLTIVLYPTIVAHVAETLALALLARYLEAPSRTRGFAAAAATAFAGSIHAGTFANLAMFFPFLALATRRAWPLVLGGTGLGFSFLLSYRHYLGLVPVVLQSPSEAPFSIYWLQLEPPQQFAFMGGYAWPLLGLAGLFLLRRSEGRALLVAWVLSFLLMRGLRVGLGPPGAHLKELQWVAPLVALGVGQALGTLSVKRKWLAVGSIAILAALTSRWLVEHERWILPVIGDAEAGELSASPPAIKGSSVSGHRGGDLRAVRHDVPGVAVLLDDYRVETAGRSAFGRRARDFPRPVRDDDVGRHDVDGRAMDVDGALAERPERLGDALLNGRPTLVGGAEEVDEVRVLAIE
jgi:hypothetical protein